MAKQEMSRLAIITGGAVLALGACVQTPTAAKMSLVEAKQICATKATRFGRTPIPTVDSSGSTQIGLLSELPDDFQVQDYYRRCVFANSGQRPTEKLKWRL